MKLFAFFAFAFAQENQCPGQFSITLSNWIFIWLRLIRQPFRPIARER